MTDSLPPADGALQPLRDRLDAVDRRLVAALAERQRLVSDVAAVKADPALPLRDAARERDVLARMAALAEGEGVDGYFVQQLYRRILDHSVRFQAVRQGAEAGAGAPLVVAYQGVEASYSHAAARAHFAAAPRPVGAHGYPTFAGAMDALARGEADLAFLPIENSVVGSITDTYDLLAAREDVHVVGEWVLRVEHCLLALEGVPLGRIRRVGSHPQALAQCSAFLDGLRDCRVEFEEDTAAAARLVAESGDPSRAAIASEEAAARYGLAVVRRHVANRKENFTRFVALARAPAAADVRLPHKTSLLLTLAHERGALARVLDALARRGVNLTKLESRPSRERPWQYEFHLDLEGGPHEAPVAEALAEVSQHADAVRVLGSYPRHVVGDERAEPLPLMAAPPTSLAAPSVVPAPAPPGIVAKSNGAGKQPKGSRAYRAEDTVVEVGGVRIGGDEPFVLIAGPCSVESREQIFACARAVREAGGGLLRGGCFKPRTSPYDFQGMGLDGLALLHEAGRAYGLPIVTEVLRPDDVAAVAREADVLQIGARNMQNFALLTAVGRTRIPVLLKRGLMASVDEWLAAAEYVLAAGNARVILCERGIRTFETATRNTLDLSSVPVLRERTHLPIIVDPSHAAGRRSLVPALTRAAKAVGAHGAMVEVHPDPDHARSDGPQSLDLAAWAALARELTAAPVAVAA